MHTTNYTDTQLLRMFPVLLPEDVKWEECESCLSEIEIGELDEESACNPFRWRDLVNREVKPTEYLDLCRRIEEKMTGIEQSTYGSLLVDLTAAKWKVTEKGQTISGISKFPLIHASWQQRLIALCEVLGKEIPEV